MSKTGFTEKELPDRTIEEIEAFRDALRERVCKGMDNASYRTYNSEWADRLDAYLATRHATEGSIAQ